MNKIHKRVSSGNGVLIESIPTMKFRRWCSKVCLISAFIFVICVFVLLPLQRQQYLRLKISTTLQPLELDVLGLTSLYKNEIIEMDTKVTDFTPFSWSRHWVRNNYETLREMNESCKCRKKLRYLICVPSAVGNSNNRNAVRETWGNDISLHGDSQMVFILGLSDKKEENDLAIREAEHFGDIVFYEMRDTYRNATLKSIAMLKWAKECEPTFLVKADDDTYLNFGNLRKTIELLRKSLKYFVAGRSRIAAQPVRDVYNKWYVSKEEYRDSTYPDYIGGAMYIITGNVLQQLYECALKTPYLSMEDVFITGMLTTKQKIPRIGLSSVEMLGEYGYCAEYDTISVHPAIPEEIRARHNFLKWFIKECSSFLGLQFCRCVPLLNSISA